MPMRDSTVNDPRIVARPASLTDAMRAVAVPFVVTRLGVLLVGLAAAVFIGYTPNPGEPSAWRIAVDPVRNLLARWDAFWYLDIASRGYQWNGNTLEQQNVVFFPLFPLLMRVGGAAIGGHPLIAGLVVSLAAFLPALCYFWRWTADRAGADAATGAVWLLSAFPSAIFFSAVYTESLYLLIAVSACYYAERHLFGRTAMAGVIAGLVRPNGLVLSIPIGWFAFAGHREGQHVTSRIAAVVAPVAGVVCFSAYLMWRTGDATAWLTDQAAWPDNFGVSASDAARAPINFWWVPNAASLGLVLIALAPLTTLLGAAFGLFVVGNIAPALVRHGLLSMGRFCSVLFPVFAWLATRVRGRARTRLIVAFAVGQAVLAALFFTWHPII
jgi:Gpi18-like mannosyltransferase